MAKASKQFKLASDTEHYLSLLSKIYGQEGEHLKQEILVNANVRVDEGTSYDNLDGGINGHTLYLILPETLYLKLVTQREKLQHEIKADLNRLHNVQSEFIEEVFIEAEGIVDSDWRNESGLLIRDRRVIAPSTENRIWPAGGFRLFVSHKSTIKSKATELKRELAAWGISCFVAHEDIHPTKKWQDEIENALFSMDALVALMDDDFHTSYWTDQEVGCAFGRGVPIVAVKIKMDADPYGFIGKFQALSCAWENMPIELVKLFIKYDVMLNAYIGAVAKCKSFDEGNKLAKVLPLVDKLSTTQAQRLVDTYNENYEVKGSYGFNGRQPSFYGEGLAYHLKRITGKDHELS